MVPKRQCLCKSSRRYVRKIPDSWAKPLETLVLSVWGGSWSFLFLTVIPIGSVLVPEVCEMWACVLVLFDCGFEAGLTQHERSNHFELHPVTPLLNTP